ncbi:MAG: hypothetical protein Unbinned465contig1000_20 [Prokaryotic dsDNA virus sp.]|nr:MAG: hypothetical protein Unbinned465contig1000_20 [Prokaryotic dsDNA virus sp.]|tara:strand:- start:5518 stop:6927 length:1410 start_codon:yes stop_codon:yes gene_type:complete
MASRIQVRRGTENDWSSIATSVVLAAGEPAVATGNSKGPILYFGDGTSTFSALKAQVASFTPQSGSGTRNGHITAENDDYTFAMLESGDARSGDTYGMGNGSTLHVKDGATMTFGADGSGTATTVTVHDNVTTDFRNIPSFYDGVNIHVGVHTATSSADGTVSIKRDTTDVLKVDDHGNIVLTPNNDSGTADTNVTLTMSDNADTALDIKTAAGATIVKVEDDSVKSIEPIILGSTPDHAIPASFASIRSGTTPNNTDSGAADEQKDAEHIRLHVQGDSVGNQRGQLKLVGNQSVTSSMKALVVAKNSVTDAGFNVDYTGDTLMHDAAITQTGRTLQDDSLVRKDELLATVLGGITSVSPTAAVSNSDSSFPIGAMRMWVERDSGASTFAVSFSKLGQDGDSNISMENAPTGTYLVLGWGADLLSNKFRVQTAQSAVVTHTNTGSGSDTSCFTLDPAGHSSYGMVIRLS